MIKQEATTENHPIHCYDRLIKAMIGDAILNSGLSDEDYKWLHESEIAEAFCEVVDEDIYSCREYATMMREKKHLWMKLDLMQTEFEGNIKLGALAKEAIRAEYAAGGIMQKDLAEKWEVTRTTISHVIKNRRR
jgi:hypothetical protein